MHLFDSRTTASAERMRGGSRGLVWLGAVLCVTLIGAEAFAQVKAQLPRRIGMPQGGTPLSRGPVWSTPRPAPYTHGSGGLPIDGGHDHGPRRGDGHYTYSDSGVSVSIGDDGYGIKFHTGRDPALTHKPGDRHPGHRPKYKIVYVPTYYGYPYFYSPYRFWYSRRPWYSQIDGVYIRRVEPQPQAETIEQEPEDPPTEAEMGAYLLRRDKPSEAVLRFRRHLVDHPDDTATMRGLAVALLVDGRFTEGHAMMSMAYREDPSLADDPIDPTLYFGSERDFERTTRRCTIQANRARLSGSFLTVVVLMQAEGNSEAAGRVLGKARDAGLEVEVADALERALGL